MLHAPAQAGCPGHVFCRRIQEVERSVQIGALQQRLLEQLSWWMHVHIVDQLACLRCAQAFTVHPNIGGDTVQFTRTAISVNSSSHVFRPLPFQAFCGSFMVQSRTIYASVKYSILLPFNDSCGVSWLTAATNRNCQWKSERFCCLHTAMCYITPLNLASILYRMLPQGRNSDRNC